MLLFWSKQAHGEIQSKGANPPQFGLTPLGEAYAHLLGAIPVVDAAHLNGVSFNRTGLSQRAILARHDVQLGDLLANQHAAALGMFFVLVFNVDCGFFTRLSHLRFGGAV